MVSDIVIEENNILFFRVHSTPQMGIVQFRETVQSALSTYLAFSVLSLQLGMTADFRHMNIVHPPFAKLDCDYSDDEISSRNTN